MPDVGSQSERDTALYLHIDDARVLCNFTSARPCADAGVTVVRVVTPCDDVHI